MNKRFILLVCLTFIFQNAYIFSQQFQEVFSDSISFYDECKWFDYDNDGDLDIILASGEWLPESEYFYIYQNDNGNFIRNTEIKIPHYESFNVGDVNNDNSVDVIASSYHEARAYLNLSDTLWNNYRYFGHFYGGTINVADLNNDGFSDLLLFGNNSSVIRYNQNGYNNDNETTLFPTESGFADISDFDNDGFIDIYLSVVDSWSNPRHLVLKNYNNEFFSSKFSFNPGFRTNYGGLSDFDNDGYDDLYLLHCAPNYNPGNRFFYRNLSGNDFIQQDNLSVDSIYYSQNISGDFNNDGLLDIFTISSIINNYYIPEHPVILSLNQGNFNFKSIVDTTFNNISYGKVTLGDYNNDGALDILISGSYVKLLPSGFYEYKKFLKLFKNIILKENTRPDYPKFLINSIINNNSVQLTWGSGSDTETDSIGLNYNIYVVSESGNFIVSPMADIETGFKKTVDRGNTYHSLHKLIKNLPAGRYKWSVQSIDNSYCSSNFAPPDSFNILPTSDFVLPANGCSKLDVIIKYSGNVLTDSNTKFIWSTDGGIIKQYLYSNEFLITWDTGGVKNVSLIVIRDGLISNSTSHQINIKNTPEPFFNIPKEICVYDTIDVIYTGNSEMGTTIKFMFEDGSMTYATGKGPFKVYWGYPGWKEVTLTADYNGCVSDSSLSVYILPVPDIKQLCYVSIDTSNIINVYVNDYNVKSGDINTIYRINFDGSYKPIFGYNSNFIGSVVDTIFSDESKYYSYFKQTENSFGCISKSKIVKPIILDYMLYGDSRLKLFWKNENAEIIEQSIYIEHKTEQNSIDNEVELYVYETNYFDHIVYGEDLYYRIHNEIENNCFDNGVADIYSNTLKINFDTDSLKFNLYPNPFHDKLYINSNISFEYARVNLYDINGILVLNSSVNSNNFIDFSNLSAGIYIIRVFTNRNVYQTKIVKY